MFSAIVTHPQVNTHDIQEWNLCTDPSTSVRLVLRKQRSEKGEMKSFPKWMQLKSRKKRWTPSFLLRCETHFGLSL